MTAETALPLGRALTTLIRTGRRLVRRPKAAVGHDTRLSGDMLSSVVAAGVMSQGGDAYPSRILATTGLANLTASTRADAGPVISTSHDPFQDNGHNIFDGQGYKPPDDTETRLEALMDDEAALDAGRPVSEAVGRAWRVDDAVGRHVPALKAAFPKSMTPKGVTMVLDRADWADHESAPTVFDGLGATVHVLGTSPDGLNINQGRGSLHPGIRAEKVVEVGAGLGVALDGDADRAILIDHGGRVVDGDKVMFPRATHLKCRCELNRDAIAATVMSDMGLELALEREGVRLTRTGVEYRHVAERLRRERLNFGGEKSGHLIFLDHSTTGDATLAALQTPANGHHRKVP